ncbi:MAG: MFS transporter [Anaerolineae bacterium]|nr:MAG: MFS transporter [Anaerolineae bacterium]
MRDSRVVTRPARVLLPLGLGTALSLMGDATLYTILPTHTADAGIALGSVGIILGVNRAIRLVSNGPTGLAYDRWPRRRLFIPALFIGALSTAVYAATRGFWPVLVGRLLWGLAWSGIWVGGATIILDVTTDQDRGRWIGLYQTWFFLGAAFGALLGGLLTDWLGYTATMWIGAAATATGGLAALFLLPETHSTHSLLAVSPTKVTTSRLRPSASLWIAVSLQGVNRFVTAGVLSATMALLVKERLQSTNLAFGVATLTGVLMAGRTLLSTVSAPVAGTLSDWLKSRWQVTTGGVAIGIVSMAFLAWSKPAAILAGVSLAAVTGGTVQSLVIALTGDLVSQAQRGRAIGLLHTAGDFGSAVGPPIAYALIPGIGLPGVYLLCAGLFATALLSMVLFQRHAAPVKSCDARQTRV